jgi:trehalose 6-phosphate phosphatase
LRLVSDLDAALTPFRSRPGASAVVVDFDGTLAPIVNDPAAARPVEGSTEVLERLVGRYALVALVSGRPVEFLRPLVPDGVVLAGLYGLEVVRDGQRLDHPGAGAWREVVTDVVRSSIDRGPAGMEVESKGLSLTLHYRNHPEIADEVREWARRQAARSGLEARPAKMSVELHPPIPADKGTALEALVDDLDNVLYIGDDHGDLPAFDALDRLARAGVTVLRVAVAGEEAPDELVARADLLVDGPTGVLDVLRRLAAD